MVSRLGGLSLPRKNVARLTDLPDTTISTYRGRDNINNTTTRTTVVLNWTELFENEHYIYKDDIWIFSYVKEKNGKPSLANHHMQMCIPSFRSIPYTRRYSQIFGFVIALGKAKIVYNFESFKALGGAMFISQNKRARNIVTYRRKLEVQNCIRYIENSFFFCLCFLIERNVIKCRFGCSC